VLETFPTPPKDGSILAGFFPGYGLARMKRSVLIPLALACVFAVATLAGCGGGDDAGSGASADPDPTTSVSVEQFKAGFAEQTGVELTAEDFPGDTVLLEFDDDGDAFKMSEAEAAYIEEYGTAQIYVVEPGVDPEMIFDVVTGGNLDEAPVESGSDTVRLVTNIADEPDADGVIWVEQCVRFEDQESRNTCAWTGNKLYGSNVIVSWTADGDTLDEAATRLDEAVSAAVTGA
jgi:hypothetical protein